LTVKVERRLAALKSSTQFNGFQPRLWPLPVSEAKASGMVSSQKQGFQVSESHQKSRSAERSKLGADGRTERAF
jgi:hypothetical protein